MSYSITNLTSEQKRQLLAELLQAPRYPLSFAQQRLWFLEQLQPGLATYNLPAAFEVKGSVRLDILEQSIRALIDRHEALRTSFVNVAGEPFQQVHAAAKLQNKPVLQVITTQHSEVSEIIHTEAAQPFDLTQAPLFRAAFLTLSPKSSILLFTLHHLIADYESLRLLISELTATYHALYTRQQPHLLQLPIQYADYAAWQHEWLNTPGCAAQLDYWRKQLHNLPLLQMPTDFSRPAIQSFRGAKRSFSLSLELSESLKTLSRQANTTLFIILLAAFQTLLYRYTGQTDIAVGSPVANRNRPEVAGLIGLFVNNLVFRAQVFPHLSFRELLNQVHDTSLNAYAHQDLPFEYLVEHLQPDRHLSHNPLFQVAFVLHNQSTATAIDLPDLSLRYLEPEGKTARFDLSFDLSETADGLQGIVEYSTDLFKADRIERLIGHWQTLLNSVVQNPGQRIAALPLLTLAEQQQFKQWSYHSKLFNQQLDEWLDCGCHQMVEQQAERTPDAIAVVYANQQLSYRELNHRANQLAHFLLAQTAHPNALIAVCLDRCLELPIVLLAILKARAAYLPLDPTLPSDRLSFLFSDAEPHIVLTHSAIALPANAALRINLDSLDLSLYPSLFSSLSLISLFPAYLLYTSGSTGIPKAVQISHRSLANFLHSMQQHPGLVAADVLLAVTTLSFDIAALELWLPLAAGATVVIADRNTAAGDGLLDALKRHQITVMQATPATWRLLISTGWQGRLKALCGGEALDIKLASQLIERGAEVWNLYGPTETTIWSSVQRVEANLETGDLEVATVPLGQPIANTEFHVLDAQGQPVPIGVAGELCIGGAGLALGYLHRPDLTAEKFIPHAQGRLYRTGDRVCYRADGRLDYLGRLDDQIKLRGFRIELGEIAAVLTQHPAVQTAVVVRHTESIQTEGIQTENKIDNKTENILEPCLIAYFVPVADVAPPLREFLAAKLPGYMLPALFVPLESMPLTPNGKINRRALPLPCERVNQSTSQILAPRNPAEATLLDIWKTILQRTLIGVTENFFELGGHSLLATRVISQIQQKFGVELPLRQLFEQPTIAALAAAIQIAQTQDCPLAAIPPQPKQAPILLSYAQQRQWFLAQLEPDSPFYNIPAAIQISGQLDIAVLQQCFEHVLQRHQVMRTGFQTVAGQPVAQINSNWRISLPLINLSQMPAEVQQQQVQQLAQQEAQRPFAIQQSPLLRVQLLQCKPTEFVLLLTLHHLVADGWSISILLQEVVTLYAALRRGESAALPQLPIQYSDFAAWQRSQTERFATQLAYWQQQLQDLPALLELPTRARSAVPNWQGNRYSFEISDSVTRGLRSLSQQQGCTLFMTLLAASQTLLARYSGTTDIAIGSPIANRNRSELEPLIGCFANTLVFRTDLSGNPSFLDLLKRVQKTALDAYTHQDLPFEQLVDALKPQRSLSHTPLFQVFLLFQPASLQPIMLDGLCWRPLEIDRQTAKFDLTLAIQETAAGLMANLEYRCDLFEAEMIHRMAGHLQILLEGIVARPEQRLSQLPLLSPIEQQQLQQWHDTHHDYPSSLIHDLFTAQLDHTPDRIALLWHHQQLSYSTLNAQANQLAHLLQALGAAPETRIGICLPRTPALVIAILATLKAGAAYVPLDPSYPTERLCWIAQDAAISILITDSQMQTIGQHNQIVVNLDKEWARITSYPISPVETTAAPSNLAYIIYTSGSTGVPKGVAVEHRSTVAFLHWVRETYSAKQLAVVLAATSICFDLSIFELFAPLSWGGTIVLADNALQLPTLPAAHHITLLNTVPAAAAALVQLHAIPANICTLNLAGEALTASLVEQIHRHTAVHQLYNLYGPSEDTTYSTYTSITATGAGATTGATPTIGQPISNSQAHILDSHLQPLPIGVPGELYLSGAGLARGYLNRPELSAERFLPNPFSAAARLYKTGDLARYRSDGSIEYLGRLDQQVKLRGFRIELGEIESLLLQHPAVQQAAVTLTTPPNCLPQLIAHIVPSLFSNTHALIAQLHIYLQTQLPAYMLPTLITVQEAFPLTPNGKLDRICLSKIVPNLPPDLASEIPQTPAEQSLQQIWQQILGREAIGRRDNFFELGGDSILVIQMIAKASQVGLYFSPKQVFQHQTIAALAAGVTATGAAPAPQDILTGTVPLIPIQRWFFEQNFAEMHHWNQAILLEVQQPIRLGLLEQAVQQLVNHHDSLRLRFEYDGASWQQEYADAATTAPLQWIDLSPIPESQQTQAIETTAAALQSSLNLSNSLLRVVFFDRGARSGRILLILHHLLVDGISWRILLSDLHSLYENLSLSKAAQLPPKTSAFRQWAEALTSYALSPQELEHWQTEHPVVPLPTDLVGCNQVADLETVSVALSAADTEALLQAAPAYQAQINDLLLTALVQAFSTWTGHSTLLIELESHGREDLFHNIDLSRTVGWFTALFPVWLDLGQTDTATALKAVKEQLRAIPSGIGYGILRYLQTQHLDWLDLPAAKPQVRFNYLGQVDQLLNENLLFNLASEAVGHLRSPNSHRDVLLEVNALVRNGQLRLDWSYSRAIHRHSTISTLAEQYLIALRQLIQHCLSHEASGYTPSDFPLMHIDQADLDQLLAEL